VPSTCDAAPFYLAPRARISPPVPARAGGYSTSHTGWTPGVMAKRSTVDDSPRDFKRARRWYGEPKLTRITGLQRWRGPPRGKRWSGQERVSGPREAVSLGGPLLSAAVSGRHFVVAAFDDLGSDPLEGDLA